MTPPGATCCRSHLSRQVEDRRRRSADGVRRKLPTLRLPPPALGLGDGAWGDWANSPAAGFDSTPKSAGEEGTTTLRPFARACFNCAWGHTQWVGGGRAVQREARGGHGGGGGGFVCCCWQTPQRAATCFRDILRRRSSHSRHPRVPRAPHAPQTRAKYSWRAVGGRQGASGDPQAKNERVRKAAVSL